MSAGGVASSARCLGFVGVSALLVGVLAIGAPACAPEKADAAPPSADPAAPDAAQSDAAVSEPYPNDIVPPHPCRDKSAIDAKKFPYKTARVVANACTTSELDALTTFFRSKTNARQDVSISEWSAEVSASCAQCVFGDGTGASWPPILTKGDQLDNVNHGGCVEVASGNVACGRAYQQAAECRLEVFVTCSSDFEGVSEQRCKGARDTLDAACGSGLAAYKDACVNEAYTFEASIRAQCVTGD
ncbi:MAG: hypothetical protein KF764_33660 [Labilithrix sp.]|nr:hypothetical protein [Labilithrix sp.]